MAANSPVGYYTNLRCEVSTGIENAWRVSVFGTSRHHGTRETLDVNAAPTVESGQRWCEAYIARLLGAKSIELMWDAESPEPEGGAVWRASLNLDVS